ncbi:YuzD family protein [Virgibacillus siamensis]|uniref:YuzD family protein n=1 Tax=Virgibacillus siamensis TaxID=480071 RepID=A0ABP3QDB7_9BACI
MGKNLQITVYGAEQICASCVGAPGSKDTYEWLQAAIGRKYVADDIMYEYIDIDNPPEINKHQDFVKRIFDEDLFYPIVLVNEELVAEGIPRLKTIYKELDKHGIDLQL